MSDLLHAPFYARLPTLPALSPSRHLHYAPRRANSASSTSPTANASSSTATKKASLRPPSANMIRQNPHRRATQFYDGHTIIIPSIQEVVKINTRTQHIRTQDALLKQADQIKGQNTPSKIRTTRNIKAELLPTVLLECCKDEPCYAYLLSELAKAIERHRDGARASTSANDDTVNIMTRDSNATGNNEQALKTERKDEEESGRSPGNQGIASGDVASLAKLVAKKEIEAEAYRKRMDHMKTTLTKLNREIQIAKTTIGALNSEISRLESIHQISMEARAPKNLKEWMINLNKTAQMILQSE